MELIDSEFEKFLTEFKPTLKAEVEFRLYYNDDGSIICYSCDKLEGKYIVIDALTYAECRQDISVVDGKMQILKPVLLLQRLTESSRGTRCAIEDINIVVDDEYQGKTIKWEMKKYEFECS